MDTQKITETNEEQKDDGYLILKEAEDIIKHNSNRSKWQKFLLFFLLPTLILTLLLFIFSTAFALSRMNSSTILNGISIQGIDVSNLTKEEALNKISLAVNEHISPNIQAYHGEFECEFSPSQLDANFDITSAVDKAYGIGRSDNIFKNNFSILNVLMSGLNINIEVTYDTESLNSIITNINDLLPNKLVNPDYYIDNTSLIITSGTDGYIVDNNKFTYEVLQALSNIRESSRFEIPVKNATASNINIDEIYKNISWGGPDFKFTNNRNYPIKIMTDTSNKILNIYIYGLKTENDYTVKLEARYLSTVYYSTTYQKDASLAPGETKTIQSGSNGCKTATYKYLYDKAGNLVSSECISRDTYNPHNAIIAVGE